MLTELFQGKPDLAEVDWRDDQTYQAAKRTLDEAARLCTERKQVADQLWREAHAGSEIMRQPSPGDRCWPARELWLEADRAWEDAKREAARAEASAKQALRRIGEEAGRAKWEEAERDIFPRLIAWCREYETLRAEVELKTGVRLPETSSACCLTAHDLSTFCENARKSFGA